MEIAVFPNPGSGSNYAVKVIAQMIRARDNVVLGLASGNTPTRLYQGLIKCHKQEGLDFSHVTVFVLDEYTGLTADNPNSFFSYYHSNFFNHVNLNSKRIHLFDGRAADILGQCSAYEQEISRAGGIDLQVLGIGGNGHIAFNEPGSSFESRTRVVQLTEQTRLDNASGFSSFDAVPTGSVTMGIGTIMESKSCMLLAFGSKKSTIVAKALEGEVTEQVPASVLQRHPSLQVILDLDAAAGLRGDLHRA